MSLQKDDDSKTALADRNIAGTSLTGRRARGVIRAVAGTGETSARSATPDAPDENEQTVAPGPVAEQQTVAAPVQENRRSWLRFGGLSFLLIVAIPIALVAYYYAFVASDQYQSEMRFAVRGTEATPTIELPIPSLPGGSTQSEDAYIVIDYIRSSQVIIDIRQQLGIDLRQNFSNDSIDPLYRIDPDMPLEEFAEYWNWMIEADFNSTTGITTFSSFAFSGESAGEIAGAVLKVSAKLINDLSTDAQTQLISAAQGEVDRTEKRLVAARGALQDYQEITQIVDPTKTAEPEVILKLQIQIVDLKARRAALVANGVSNSPAIRVIDRSLEALEAQIQAARRTIGSGKSKDINNAQSDNETYSAIFRQFRALTLEQEFAEKAYTSALTSLESSQAEARKQERYFAIIVRPQAPSTALLPQRVVNTLLAFLALLTIWLITYLVYQAVRDHSG